MQQSQDFKNHARFDPPFHFFLAPVLLLNLIFTILVTIHRWPYQRVVHLWLVLMAVVLFVMLGMLRQYALKVQDRVIRLEEGLRYVQLLSPEVIIASRALSIKQIIALRFASDAELPAMIQRAVAENLAPKAIKQAITVWRPDTFRV